MTPCPEAPPRQVVIRLLDERIALQIPLAALLCLTALALLLVAALAACLMIGSQGMGVRTVMDALLGGDVDPSLRSIVWDFRFPRALVSIMAGAMFAISGLALQTLTRNGLADPSLVGISQGAGLAVVIATVIAPVAAAGARPAVAFLGSMGAALLVQMLARGSRGTASMRFILTGIGVAALISAGRAVFMTYGDIDRVEPVLSWLSGSISDVGWEDVRLLALSLCVLLPAALMLSRVGSGLRAGDDVALALGLEVGRTRRAWLMLAVALAAIATATVGPIGFVGLIAPHAARRMVTAGFGATILVTAAVGGLLVCIADLAGRMMFAPVQIPAGLVIDLIGVPVFFLLLVRATGRRVL